jgi:hypothetical protein
MRKDHKETAAGIPLIQASFFASLDIYTTIH